MVHLHLCCFQSTAVWELMALSQMMSEKRDLPQSISSNWIRTKVCFGLLKSSLLCLRRVGKYAEKQRNLKLKLMYLTLPPKYKLDGNHKTNIDTFEFCFSQILN